MKTKQIFWAYEGSPVAKEFNSSKRCWVLSVGTSIIFGHPDFCKVLERGNSIPLPWRFGAMPRAFDGIRYLLETEL